MFNYENAFSRNLGWVTSEEQQKIKKFKVAIIGLGGVGGHHLHCLARMGFSNFKISDLDSFEIHNFNRQYGSSMSTIGKTKIDILKETVLDINPEANIQTFPKGINLENMEEFLDGVDLVCDGLDIFATNLRGPIYELAHKKGIYVVTAGPFGLGTSLMAFSPKKMSFNQYFDLEKENLSNEDKIIRFLAGMSPSIMHRKYIASLEDIDLMKGKLPSIHSGCYAASAALSSVVFKIALDRGHVEFAPRSYQVDFYLNKMKKSWMPFGNKNPIQKIKIYIMRKILKVS